MVFDTDPNELLQIIGELYVEKTKAVQMIMTQRQQLTLREEEIDSLKAQLETSTGEE